MDQGPILTISSVLESMAATWRKTLTVTFEASVAAVTFGAAVVVLGIWPVAEVDAAGAAVVAADSLRSVASVLALVAVEVESGLLLVAFAASTSAARLTGSISLAATCRSSTMAERCTAWL